MVPREQTRRPLSPISVRSTSILAFALLVVPGVKSAPPQFDVATVRQSPPPPGDSINITLGAVRNGTLTFTNASLSDCLKFAYGIVSDDQLIGPDWIKSKAVRFDIVAQTSSGTSREQLALMMRPLLAERLKLVVHHEQKTLPFLALVIGRKGANIKVATRRNNATPSTSNMSAAGRISSDNISMQLFATLLSRFERQIVVDMTGLAGEYEIHLEWTPAPITAGPSEQPAGPSLFTAVQEQLGLKLEARKGPLDALVVDHAEKIPTEN